MRAAVLVVRRAAERADALAHAVVAAAAANAPDDRPLAARILVDIQPHVPQRPGPVADVDVLEVRGEVAPLHPEEAVVDLLAAAARLLHLAVRRPQRRAVRPLLAGNAPRQTTAGE